MNVFKFCIMTIPIKRIEPITFIGIALAFIAPIYPLMATVITFIVADALLEVINSFKNHQFCPTFVKRFLLKFFSYNICLIIIYVLEVNLLGEFVKMIMNVPLLLTKIVSVGLIWLELNSIDENFYKITGKRFVKEFKKLIIFGKEIRNEIKDESK
ncbi:Bacteriophage holin family [uncultured Caudovirales phage]|uniref:Bacteriophage holin family n=1 Tax=uncultured Caudovirales phage TaxID=2100421 RepID=A0A6J5MTS7_9CAUD|nr:Bacteriophage holin family [uncultured Caudovirales phage]